MAPERDEFNRNWLLLPDVVIPRRWLGTTCILDGEHGGSMLTRFATTLCVLTSILLVGLSVLPWLPPLPTYDLWRLRLASAELSTWGLAVACFCFVLVLVAMRRVKSKLLVVSLALLSFCIGFDAMPLFETWSAAKASNVELSLPRYFVGENPTAEEITDVEYTKGLRLDVYLPPGHNRQRAIPAILMIHGGGWNHGNKSDYAKCNRWLARNGYAVFDMDYRLAGPKAQFPTQEDDVATALHWLDDHAAEYGVDNRRIALMGRSAGSQLALLTAYDRAANSSAPDVKPVKAVIGLYGPTDLIWGYNNIAAPDVLNCRFLLENYLGGNPTAAKKTYESASPLLKVTPRCAPTLLIHGRRDHIVGLHHTLALREALDQCGVPAEVLELPTADHAFDFNFDGWNSQIEQEVLLRFLRKHLSATATATSLLPAERSAKAE